MQLMFTYAYIYLISVLLLANILYFHVIFILGQNKTLLKLALIE